MFLTREDRTLPSMGGLDVSDPAHAPHKNRAFFSHLPEKYKTKPALVFLKIQRPGLSLP